jgi:hypothetical protein
MKGRLFILAPVLVMVMTLARAEGALRAEDAMESRASLIELPAAALGNVSVSSCAECLTQRFAVTATSSYLVNGSAVSLDELRLILARNRDVAVVVAYYSATQELSRIMVTGTVRQ